MRWYISLYMVLLLSVSPGCVYMADRGRDFTDIVTISGEVGVINANLQVGDANVGLGVTGGYGAGFRSGAVGIYETMDMNLFLVSAKYFEPNDEGIRRGKGYEYTVVPNFWREEDENFAEVEMEYGEKYNLYQIELAVTLGVGVRLGLNFAEMADFILGFFTMDILQDDQNSSEARAAEFQRQQNILDELQNRPEEPVTFLKPTIDKTDEFQL